MKGQPRINTIWAVICTDNDKTEAVPAFMGITGMYPLYVTDPTNLEYLRIFAARVAFEQKRSCVLAKFTVREDLENFPVAP